MTGGIPKLIKILDRHLGKRRGGYNERVGDFVHKGPTTLHLLLTLKSCPAVMTGSKVHVEEAGSVLAGRTSREKGEFRRFCLTMPPYFDVKM